MCEYCEEIKPGDENEKILARDVGDECYDQLVMGRDEEDKIYLRAIGIYDATWYPNFCPVCGRDLRQSNRPASGKDLIGQILAKAEQGRILIDSIQNKDNHEI